METATSKFLHGSIFTAASAVEVHSLWAKLVQRMSGVCLERVALRSRSVHPNNHQNCSRAFNNLFGTNPHFRPSEAGYIVYRCLAKRAVQPMVLAVLRAGLSASWLQRVAGSYLGLQP
eukprot:315771-Amphidinium_carterae.1